MEHPVWESAAAQDHITFRGHLSTNARHRQARHWDDTQHNGLPQRRTARTSDNLKQGRNSHKNSRTVTLAYQLSLEAGECNLQVSVNTNCLLQSNITNATDWPLWLPACHHTPTAVWREKGVPEALVKAWDLHDLLRVTQHGRQRQITQHTHRAGAFEKAWDGTAFQTYSIKKGTG